jgi:hypothetical protein
MYLNYLGEKNHTQEEIDREKGNFEVSKTVTRMNY